jgi:mono/diheme cytochrome c family protein
MAQSGGGDGLWRWLVGGLAGGGVLLGLLVAAYAVGYSRGEHHAGRVSTTSAAPAPAPAQPAPPQPATTAPTSTGAATTPAQAVARGKELYAADACSGCHTLDGSASSGQTFAGLAGSQVTLADGSTVTADDAYLAESITDPDAKVVKGYQPGIMPAAVSNFGLSGKPDEVRALVAFIDAQK